MFQESLSSEGTFEVISEKEGGGGGVEEGAVRADGRGAGREGPLGWMEPISASPFFLLA